MRFPAPRFRRATRSRFASNCLRVIEPISGGVSIVRYEAASDPKGKVQSYRVWVKRSEKKFLADHRRPLDDLAALARAAQAPTSTASSRNGRAAASFQTLQADFVWDQYQRVVDEHDTQKGTVYYRRSGKEIEMMADIKDPDQKFLLYKDGKLQVYQPKIEQVMEYTAGANHNEIESYLVLGFGGSGQDLKNNSTSPIRVRKPSTILQPRNCS